VTSRIYFWPSTFFEPSSSSNNLMSFCASSAVRQHQISQKRNREDRNEHL
jgi:hypothetical protein